LKIPKGIERKPVTALCEKKSATGNHQSSMPADRRAFGTLGHEVLEELAKNNWNGEIPDCASEFPGLIEQLEAARAVLQTETAGAEALFAEHPFVLKRGDLILDGSIDLLVKKSSKVWKILDYKFSNELPEVALETYGPQLAAYQEAVEKLNPGAEVSAALVLIGETVQVISSRG
jgi:hypothetical protein